MAILYREYRIVGDLGEYQIAENFGNYRLLKKKFKTIEEAQDQAKRMSIDRNNGVDVYQN